MSNSERFDRLTALLKEVELKKDKVLADICSTLDEVWAQNAALEQMHTSLNALSISMTNANYEVTNSLKETTHLVELLAADNREKSRTRSILDLLTKP